MAPKNPPSTYAYFAKEDILKYAIFHALSELNNLSWDGTQWVSLCNADARAQEDHFITQIKTAAKNLVINSSLIGLPSVDSIPEFDFLPTKKD